MNKKSNNKTQISNKLQLPKMKIPNMKLLKFIILSILIISIKCSSKEDLNSISTPEKLINNWVEMWNSYDLNLVEQLFLPDSNLTYFSSKKEGLITAIDAVQKHHKSFDFIPGGKTQSNKLWLENLKFVDFGSTSVVTGIWYFQRGSENAEEAQRGPVTFVCIRKNQTYYIAHVNFAEYDSELK